MATYRVEYRVGDHRSGEWKVQAEGLTRIAATCEIDKCFHLAFGPAKQAVQINEQSGRVVGRFEKVYDPRRSRWITKRVGTR